MDISELMEQYVTATINCEKLKQAERTAHDNYMRAKVILNEGRTDLVSPEFIEECLNAEKKAKDELKSANDILDFIYQTYEAACTSMTLQEAIESKELAEKRYQKNSQKHYELDRQKEGLNYAGKKYEQEYGYQVALSFYQKSAEYKEEMKELEPIIQEYKNFAGSLNKLVEKKKNSETKQNTGVSIK